MPRFLIVFTMQGKPMQIISICGEDDSSSSRCILQLNEDELNKMFTDGKIKDRVVSVISVAGAFRKGKSFLLDFCLRYMYAKYGHNNLSEKDWLGDENAPLEGFSWRGGSQRDTTGILIWSDIFLYDNPNGEKVAIILMDTQGTFDCDSTMKDCANVFALSTMISSVQIFNIQSNIQKDDLQHLQLFTEYARIAMEDTVKKPFQKLQFLIRDWIHKSEAPFGALGGKQLLEQTLIRKDKRPEENEQLCENLKTSFNEIDCYLMPQPGYGIEEPDFRGCLKDLRDEFKKHLRDFIPLILAPENLIIKEINGQKLKVDHLLKYIRLYFDAFNSKECPEPTTIFKATAEANNQIHATNAEELYESKMTELTSPDKPYIPEEELKRQHEEYVEQTILCYKDKPLLGKIYFLMKYCQKIKSYCSSRFQQFRQLNEAKLALAEVNYLSHMNKCILDFEYFMDELLMGDAYTPTNDFNCNMEAVKVDILQQFDSCLSNSTAVKHKQIREKLQEAIEKQFIKYRQQNDIKLDLIKANITAKSAEAKKLYKELMNNTDQSIEALNTTHADAKHEALEMFRGESQVGAERFFNECEKQLITYIEKTFNSYKEGSAKKEEFLELQLTRLKMSYEGSMKDACKSLLANHNLLSKHEKVKMKALEEFEALPTDGISEDSINEKRQQLVGEIDELFEYYRSQNDMCLLQFEQECIWKKKEAKKVILKSLEEIGVLASVDDVHSTYNTAFKEACDLYKKLEGAALFNKGIHEEYLEELKREAKAVYEWYKERAEFVEKLKKCLKGVLLTIAAAGFVAIFKVPPPL
ncbi:atlastin-like isoform X3 [Bactrocera dorsalis]|uniref:Atlastin-like isoform X3 n=1 Tax=Bactrocera dorsalis TaxID=27457 RepID=A0ABM3J1L7_BACDO|nr:atlastin-like isoform X3 [Bactrocera dorsalis]